MLHKSLKCQSFGYVVACLQSSVIYVALSGLECSAHLDGYFHSQCEVSVRILIHLFEYLLSKLSLDLLESRLSTMHSSMQYAYTQNKTRGYWVFPAISRHVTPEYLHCMVKASLHCTPEGSYKRNCWMENNICTVKCKPNIAMIMMMTVIWGKCLPQWGTRFGRHT